MPRLKTKPPIHDTLTGYDFRVDKVLTRAKAIRFKCLECCCGNSAEVRRCHIYDCTLWPYRLGRGINTDPTGDRAKSRVRVQTAGFKKRPKPESVGVAGNGGPQNAQ